MPTEFPTAYVRWSYTAARQYASCPRQFFYQRTRSGKGHSTTDADVGSASVSPPGAQIGLVIHDCIERHVDRWRHDERLSLTRVQSLASSRLQEYVSEHGEVLCEVYADDSAEPAELAKSYIRTAHNHLETFYQTIWPQFRDHRYILHEQTIHFETAGEPVTVKPDLCTRTEDGTFVISDWKTRPADPLREPSVQLLGYALCAYEEYEPDLDRILIQLVHTQDGTYDRTVPGTDDIERIRGRIQTDRAAWKTCKQFTDFEPKPAEPKCRSCAWLNQCEAGQEVTDTQD